MEFLSCQLILHAAQANTVCHVSWYSTLYQLMLCGGYTKASDFY
jgi:hypothetical protein